jgi:hypothetical protein
VPNVVAVFALVGGATDGLLVEEPEALPWLPPHAATDRHATRTTVAQRARELVGKIRGTRQPPGCELLVSLSTSLYNGKHGAAGEPHAER